MSEDLLALFRKTGALLDGHFVLRSGLHSSEYFQCAILLQHTDIAERVCKMLAEKLRSFDCDSVISPALGGIIVGQEVGRSLGKRHIFTEKEDGKLALRRGFKPCSTIKLVTGVAGISEKVIQPVETVSVGGKTTRPKSVLTAYTGRFAEPHDQRRLREISVTLLRRR